MISLWIYKGFVPTGLAHESVPKSSAIKHSVLPRKPSIIAFGAMVVISKLQRSAIFVAKMFDVAGKPCRSDILTKLSLYRSVWCDLYPSRDTYTSFQQEHWLLCRNDPLRSSFAL